MFQIDHIKLLNQSDVNYKSEEDSDFDPNDSERRDQAERDDYEDMNTSCDSEPPFEQVAAGLLIVQSLSLTWQ